MAEKPEKQQFNPTSLAIPDAAQLLSKAAGKPVTQEQLEADIEAGAPTNADGSLNLVHLAAWLVKELSSKHAD